MLNTVDLIIALNGADDATYVSALIFHHFMEVQDCHIEISVETKRAGDRLHVLRRSNAGEEYPEGVVVFNLGERTSYEFNGRPKLLWEVIYKKISEYYKNYFSDNGSKE